MQTMKQTATLGTKTYTVEATGKEVVSHILRGPRGGEIEGVRNVKSGRIYLISGARELHWYLTEIDGKVTVHAK
jgi:hypothetical protein